MGNIFDHENRILGFKTLSGACILSSDYNGKKPFLSSNIKDEDSGEEKEMVSVVTNYRLNIYERQSSAMV